MPLYVAPDATTSFIRTYPAKLGASPLQMDMDLPTGGVQFGNCLNMVGEGTTNATQGTTEQITHNLGVVPNSITLTPTANGIVYVDRSVPATSTTFNVLGSASSLTFNWKVE